MTVGMRAIVPKGTTFDWKKSQAGADKWLADFAKDFQSEMSDYPPARSEKWRRTGTLGRGWTGGAIVRHSSSSRDVSVSVTNPTTYGQYVQGKRQRDYHKVTGWQNAKKVAEVVKRRRLPYFAKLIHP